MSEPGPELPTIDEMNRKIKAEEEMAAHNCWLCRLNLPCKRHPFGRKG